MTTVRKLLLLHDLLGRQPEDRSEASRGKPVDPDALEPLFSDYDRGDPFLSDLYVGFVTGALARHQGRLYVSKQGNRAVISAGALRVKMRYSDRGYQIVLKETIPEEIRQRAAIEKRRMEQARGRARPDK